MAFLICVRKLTSPTLITPPALLWAIAHIKQSYCLLGTYARGRGSPVLNMGAQKEVWRWLDATRAAWSLASEGSKLPPFCHLNAVIYLPQHIEKWEGKDWSSYAGHVLDATDKADAGSNNSGQCLHILFSPLKGTAHAAQVGRTGWEAVVFFSGSPGCKISAFVWFSACHLPQLLHDLCLLSGTTSWLWREGSASPPSFQCSGQHKFHHCPASELGRCPPHLENLSCFSCWNRSVCTDFPSFETLSWGRQKAAPWHVVGWQRWRPCSQTQSLGASQRKTLTDFSDGQFTWMLLLPHPWKWTYPFDWTLSRLSQPGADTWYVKFWPQQLETGKVKRKGNCDTLVGSVRQF